MPHPIFEIDELISLVIDDLVEISPPTAVSLALTCRSLEEPTLRSLWKRQFSLSVLVCVLPGCNWVEDTYGSETLVSGHGFPARVIIYKLAQEIQHSPSPEDWARLQ